LVPPAGVRSRLAWAAGLACAALAAGCSVTPREGRAHNFRVEASAVEALEGGPFVLKVTLSYEGAQPLPRCLEAWEPAIEYPSPWGRRPPREGWFGRIPTPDTIRPGVIRSKYISFNYAYPHIAPGRHRLVIRWPVFQVREGEEWHG